MSGKGKKYTYTSYKQMREDFRKHILQGIESRVTHKAIEGVYVLNENITIVSSSTLAKSGIWTPEYYNIAKQKVLLLNYLQSKTSVDSMLTTLHEAATTGNIRAIHMHLYPDVCVNIKEFLRELEYNPS